MKRPIKNITSGVHCFLFVLIAVLTVSSCTKREVNITALLQEYEAGIDELIPVMEALLAGDVFQQPKFEQISKKLAPVLEALEDNQDKMSEDEMKEYIRITLKFAQFE